MRCYQQRTKPDQETGLKRGGKAMKILLQHCKTGLYLDPSGTWSRKMDGALEFASSAAAIEHCVKHRMSDVQIVLKLDETVVIALNEHAFDKSTEVPQNSAHAKDQ